MCAGRVAASEFAPSARTVPVVPDAQPPPPRVGQLTTAWQIMVATAWTAAFLALAGVWKASEEVGIATWWLGPRADPQPVPVRILPFVIVVAVALCAVYNVRSVPWISLAGTAAIGVVAAIDLWYMPGLAAAEFAVAGSVGLVSLASFGGRYRPAHDSAAPPPPTEPVPEPATPTAAGPPAAGPPAAG